MHLVQSAPLTLALLALRKWCHLHPPTLEHPRILLSDLQVQSPSQLLDQASSMRTLLLMIHSLPTMVRGPRRSSKVPLAPRCLIAPLQEEMLSGDPSLPSSLPEAEDTEVKADPDKFRAHPPTQAQQATGSPHISVDGSDSLRFRRMAQRPRDIKSMQISSQVTSQMTPAPRLLTTLPKTIARCLQTLSAKIILPLSAPPTKMRTSPRLSPLLSPPAKPRISLLPSKSPVDSTANTPRKSDEISGPSIVPEKLIVLTTLPQVPQTLPSLSSSKLDVFQVPAKEDPQDLLMEEPLA